MRSLVIVVAAALLATACGSTSSASESPSPSSAATSTPSGSPVALDPCVLVTASEASALTGTTFAAGTEGTTDGGGKTCTYGAQTANVLTVLVAQAPDAATAQADWAQEQAKAQAALQQALPAGTTANLIVADASVAGADKAAVATLNTTISGQQIAITAIYLLKGAVFLYFGDIAVGQASPTPAAMEGQAATSISRVH